MDAACNFFRVSICPHRFPSSSPGYQHASAPTEIFPVTKGKTPGILCAKCHLGIHILPCYFGMQRSATSSSAVWEKMHRASSPQIAFLHPPHQNCAVNFGCSSHIRVAFGWVQGECWLECSRGQGRERVEGEGGQEGAPDSQAEKGSKRSL